MKIAILISLFIVLHTNILIRASPPKGGIGDGYIYPVTKMGTKHKDSKTYYAKPLHPPKSGGSKPIVYKVIIHDQPSQQPTQQEHTFKIIHLPNQGGGHGGGAGGGHGGGAGGGHGSHHGKSVKILKIINVKQSQQGGHGGGWSK